MDVTEPAPEPEPEVVAEPEPELELVAEPEPVVFAEPEPEPVVVAEPAPELELVAEPEPVVVAEPAPEVVAEPEVVIESEPEVVAEPEVVIEPELEVVAEPELVAEPEPEPVVLAAPDVVAEPEPEPEAPISAEADDVTPAPPAPPAPPAAPRRVAVRELLFGPEPTHPGEEPDHEDDRPAASAAPVQSEPELPKPEPELIVKRKRVAVRELLFGSTPAPAGPEPLLASVAEPVSSPEPSAEPSAEPLTAALAPYSHDAELAEPEATAAQALADEPVSPPRLAVVGSEPEPEAAEPESDEPAEPEAAEPEAEARPETEPETQPEPEPAVNRPPVRVAVPYAGSQADPVPIPFTPWLASPSKTEETQTSAEPEAEPFTDVGLLPDTVVDPDAEPLLAPTLEVGTVLPSSASSTAARSRGDTLMPRAAWGRRALRTWVEVVQNAVSAVLIVLVLAWGVFGIGTLTNRWRLVPVLTNSMRPKLTAGEAVLATPIPASAVRVRDIIVFHAPTPEHTLTVHRVVEVIKPGAHPLVQTAGDANPTPDPFTTRLESNKAWKVRKVIPLAGFVVTQLSEPIGRLVIIVVSGLLIWRAFQRPKRRREEDEEKDAEGPKNERARKPWKRGKEGPRDELEPPLGPEPEPEEPAHGAHQVIALERIYSDTRRGSPGKGSADQ